MASSTSFMTSLIKGTSINQESNNISSPFISLDNIYLNKFSVAINLSMRGSNQCLSPLLRLSISSEISKISFLTIIIPINSETLRSHD